MALSVFFAVLLRCLSVLCVSVALSTTSMRFLRLHFLVRFPSCRAASRWQMCYPPFAGFSKGFHTGWMNCVPVGLLFGMDYFVLFFSCYTWISSSIFDIFRRSFLCFLFLRVLRRCSLLARFSTVSSLLATSNLLVISNSPLHLGLARSRTVDSSLDWRF